MLPPTTESIIRDTSKDTYALLRLLRKECAPHIPSQLPVIVLKGIGDTVKVYKNIQFNPKIIKRSIKLDATMFKPTLDFLKKSSRITVKSLETVQYIKYTTFLNTYLQLKDSALKDNEIRDLAIKLFHTLQADSVELVICKTLQDYSDLYTKVHTFSCMSPRTSYSEYKTKLKTHLYEKYGLWPSMWYYYNPHTKGVVFKVKGRPVARAILLRDDVKKKFDMFFRGIYAESEFYKVLFRRILLNKGIKESYSIPITTAFKVPPIKKLKEPICPLPFTDCIADVYNCFYNKKENVFYFGPSTKLLLESKCICSSYNYNGYLDSKLRPAHEFLSIRSIANVK